MRLGRPIHLYEHRLAPERCMFRCKLYDSVIKGKIAINVSVLVKAFVWLNVINKTELQIIYEYELRKFDTNRREQQLF